MTYKESEGSMEPWLKNNITQSVLGEAPTKLGYVSFRLYRQGFQRPFSI